jgi:hypothetical protein
MSPGWRDLVVLTFLVLLLGAAMIANVSDGPMREHRGSWVTQAMLSPMVLALDGGWRFPRGSPLGSLNVLRPLGQWPWGNSAENISVVSLTWGTLRQRRRRLRQSLSQGGQAETQRYASLPFLCIPKTPSQEVLT